MIHPSPSPLPLPSPLPPGRLFIFGLGYTSQTLARCLLSAGWNVAGTTRGADKAARLRVGGIDTFTFDRGKPLDDAAAALQGATHILTSVPPDEGGDPVFDIHGEDLAAMAAGLRWFGYLSTTGVYGNADGDWVDENSPLNAVGVRGVRRIQAEEAWMGLHQSRGLPVHLFRLPGIYGPGRSAIDALRGGTARRIDKPGQVFCRIHVDDIAGALATSMARPMPGTTWNIVDDEPEASSTVVEYAASLLGMTPPPLEPFDPGTLSPMAASFYADSRRVRNDRMRHLLGYPLIHPTYREGLAAQLVAEAEPDGMPPVTAKVNPRA